MAEVELLHVQDERVMTQLFLSSSNRALFMNAW